VRMEPLREVLSEEPQRLAVTAAANTDAFSEPNSQSAVCRQPSSTSQSAVMQPAASRLAASHSAAPRPAWQESTITPQLAVSRSSVSSRTASLPVSSRPSASQPNLTADARLQSSTEVNADALSCPASGQADARSAKASPVMQPVREYDHTFEASALASIVPQPSSQDGPGRDASTDSRARATVYGARATSMPASGQDETKQAEPVSVPESSVLMTPPSPYCSAAEVDAAVKDSMFSEVEVQIQAASQNGAVDSEQAKQLSSALSLNPLACKDQTEAMLGEALQLLRQLNQQAQQAQKAEETKKIVSSMPVPMIECAKCKSREKTCTADVPRRTGAGVSSPTESTKVGRSPDVFASHRENDACPECKQLFMVDEFFCRRCGLKREEPAQQNVSEAKLDNPQEGFGPRALLAATEAADEPRCLQILESIAEVDGSPGSRCDSQTVNRRDSQGNTALIWAAYNELPKVCLEILSRQEFDQINACDVQGNTALTWSAYRGLAEVCTAILKRLDFKQVNSLDEDGNTALHWAAERGYGEVCLAIMQRSDFREVDARDHVYGRTALHCAAYRGLEEVCHALLARTDFKEEALNAVDVVGNTALHFAALSGLGSVCKALLRHPSFTKRMAKDEAFGRTAAEWAASKGHEKLAKDIATMTHNTMIAGRHVGVNSNALGVS